MPLRFFTILLTFMVSLSCASPAWAHGLQRELITLRPLIETDTSGLAYEARNDFESEHYDRARKTWLKLARKYGKRLKIQEAIWTYRRAGATAAAKKLQRQLIDYLKTAPVTSMNADKETLRPGIHETHVVELQGGILAVFKPDNGEKKNNFRNEILAFEYDQAIGMDIVPTTVSREINGRRGSLQYFLRDTISLDDHLGWDTDVLNLPTTSDLDFFQLLILNADSNGQNRLFWEGNYFASIDHGDLTESAKEISADSLPRRSVYRRLRKVSDDDLRNVLSPWASPNFVEELVQVRKTLIKQLERQVKEIKDQGRNPFEPLDPRMDELNEEKKPSFDSNIVPPDTDLKFFLAEVVERHTPKGLQKSLKKLVEESVRSKEQKPAPYVYESEWYFNKFSRLRLVSRWYDDNRNIPGAARAMRNVLSEFQRENTISKKEFTFLMSKIVRERCKQQLED